MPEIAAYGFMGSQATQGLFGANVLATRSTLAQGGDYDRVIEDLGVGSFRYPGGSLTERYFDITNPNATVVSDRDTGDMRDFIPLNEAMAYAAEEGLSVTIVIPTHNLLTDSVDANGDRFANIDEDALRGFVRDTVNGVYGSAEVEAFELGNEYWGSGQMSSIEYGRLASEMAVIINDELDLQNADADIVVQSGTNFNFARMSEEYSDDMSSAAILADLNDSYGLNLGEDSLFSSGQVNWTHVANEMILSEFDTQAEQLAVDQVAVHVYSRGQVNEGQRSFFLNSTDETWGEDIPDARIAVTEWNTAGNTGSLDRDSDYGLHQSQEMINVMEEFLRFDVEQAHVWPLIQNTPNTLSVDDGQADLSPGGAMFAMMQDALPGKTAIDLTPERGADTEVEEDGVSVHGFWEPNELLFYVAATGDTGATTTVDFSGLVSDAGRVEISVLGVAEGDAAGSSSSDAMVDEIDPASVMAGTNLSVDMNEGEIMQVRMFDFVPSRDFQAVISEEAPDALPEPMIDPFVEDGADSDASTDLDQLFPTVPFSEADATYLAAEEAAAAEEGGEDSDDDGMGGLADLMAAIPLLGLMALFM
ncbi:type I secretion protein [Marivita sp. S6314]|uniref:type I secretion protein n=1 Tax=Marivita sp. S6314 TaxID=2926406 RepID=UPI001FF0E5D0|nr:type I secretion protein [Marivita sp. S6314]MCK0148797.1 type I secretion protein [Marivita sp. S6314]